MNLYSGTAMCRSALRLNIRKPREQKKIPAWITKKPMTSSSEKKKSHKVLHLGLVCINIPPLKITGGDRFLMFESFQGVWGL